MVLFRISIPIHGQDNIGRQSLPSCLCQRVRRFASAADVTGKPPGISTQWVGTTRHVFDMPLYRCYRAVARRSAQARRARIASWPHSLWPSVSSPSHYTVLQRQKRSSHRRRRSLRSHTCQTRARFCPARGHTATSVRRTTSGSVRAVEREVLRRSEPPVYHRSPRGSSPSPYSLPTAPRFETAQARSCPPPPKTQSMSSTRWRREPRLIREEKSYRVRRDTTLGTVREGISVMLTRATTSLHRRRRRSSRAVVATRRRNADDRVRRRR